MTALVVALTVMVALLTVLVAGLLRSHATILRRLHELDGTATDPGIRTMAGVPAPLPDPVPRAAAAAISGTTPSGGSVVFGTAAGPDTVLVFLGSGCATCARFWQDLADPTAVSLPAGTRLLVVTKGPEAESPDAVRNLAPDWVELVMSTQAWTDYGVPGSPYVIAVDGTSGRVQGEGTGLSWSQVARLLAQATGDVGYLSEQAGHSGRPESDLARETRVDRELMAAGILPSDASLYPDGSAPTGEPAAGEGADRYGIGR